MIKSNHLSIKEASFETGFSISYLRLLVRTGKIKGEKLNGLLWIVNKKDLSKLKRKRKLKE